MKTKKENFEKLASVFESFEERGDTLFAIGSCGKHNCVSFVGETWKLGRAFYEILKGGVVDEKRSTRFELMAAVLFGIRKLMDEDSVESLMFTGLLNDIMEDVVAGHVKNKGDFPSVVTNLMKHILDEFCSDDDDDEDDEPSEKPTTSKRKFRCNKNEKKDGK